MPALPSGGAPAPPEYLQQGWGSMARLNFEDSIWIDSRFIRLCILLQDEEKALGAVGFAWRTAQRFWCPERRPIPAEVFGRLASAAFLLEVGLARETPEGVYMAGSEEHFKWYFDGLEQRREAGRKSAEIRKNKYGTAVPFNASNEIPSDTEGELRTEPNDRSDDPSESERNRTAVRPPPNERRTQPNETEPSSSSSSSFSEKKEGGEDHVERSRDKKAQPPPACIFKNELVEEVLLAEHVPIPTQEVWLKAFGDDRIGFEGELKACCAKWKTVGPKKVGKPFIVYVNDWFQNRKPAAPAVAPAPVAQTAERTPAQVIAWRDSSTGEIHQGEL